MSIQRQVSNNVYNAIQKSGMLKRWRWKIFDYVWQRGRATSTEAMRDLPHGNDSTISARFTDLEQMRAIHVVGTVLDPVNGRVEVSLYEPTYQMPIPLPPKRRFWIVKSPGKVGSGFSGEKQAKEELAKEPQAELIPVIERMSRKKKISKAPVVKPE